MEPIINPMFFYLIEIWEDAKMIFFLAFLLSMIPTIGCIFIYLLNIGCYNEGNSVEEAQYYKKKIIVFSISSFVLWLLCTIIVQGDIVEFVRQLVQAVEVAK